LLLPILKTSNALSVILTPLTFKGPCWYLSFGAWFKKNILLEHKKIKLGNNGIL
jgi:hypothetical protein